MVKTFKFIFLLLIIFCSCHSISTEENKSQYKYYDILEKVLNSVVKIYNDKKYYEENLFKPEVINKIEYKIKKICHISYDYEKGMESNNGLPLVLTGFEDRFNYLIYVDKNENLYFIINDTMGDKYRKFNSSGRLLEKDVIERFYNYLLDNKNNEVTSNFYVRFGMDLSIESEEIKNEKELSYYDGENKIYSIKKDKYYYKIFEDRNGIQHDVTSQAYRGRIFARDSIIYYYSYAYINKSSLHDPLFRDFLISIYDYSEKYFKILNTYLLPLMSYYKLIGVDLQERIYFYRETANSCYLGKYGIEDFTPTFSTGEVQIYDLKKRTLTVLKHPFPDANGEKPEWAFYVVQKDGTLYCDYLLKDGHHLAKITIDWSKTEPYPEYKPVVFLEDWRNAK